GGRGAAGRLTNAFQISTQNLLRRNPDRCILSRKGVLLCTEWHCSSWSHCSASAQVIRLRRLRTGRSTPRQLRRAAVHTSACAISTHILQFTTKTERWNTFASSTTLTRSIRDTTETSISPAPRYG